MFVNQFAYILGVVYTTPDTASMFQPLVPVVVVIVAVILRTEPCPRINTKGGFAKVFGVVLAVSGAIIMTYGKQNAGDAPKSVGTPKPIGYIFLLINVSAAAVWVVLQKKYIFNKVNMRWREYPINVTAWTYFYGALFMGLASFYYTGQPDKFKIPKPEVYYCLIYSIFVTSALGYMLITWCNMLVNSSFVTASWPLQVLFCVILSYIVLGETLVALEVVGALMIISALMAVTWSNYREQNGGEKVKDDLHRTRNHSNGEGLEHLLSDN